MKSTTTVILLVFCSVQFIATSAKLINELVDDNVDDYANSNLLDTVNVEPELNNCHEACLQKVRCKKKNTKKLLKI